MPTTTQRFALLATGLCVLTATLHASAVGTRRFVLREGSDFEGGDLKGVAVDSNGQVRAGFNLGTTEVSESPTIWSALARPDGSVLLGTGNEGKLLRVTGAKVDVVGETKALVVTSLAEAWGDMVVAGTLPDGQIFKYAQGKLEEFVALEDTEHVWSVAFDAKASALYAATGPEGKLFRITQTGQAQVYFDAAEEHLMSVAVAPDGKVYVGSSDKAKLYEITGPGRATVLYDFARTEVRSIAIGPRGEVYAIANELSGSSIPKRTTQKGESPAAPSRGTKTKGKGVLFKFAPDGTPEQLLEDTKQHYTSLALGADGVPYVGTGVEGEVYSVDALHNSALVADTEERQVSALLLGGKQRYVVGSDPAVLHPVRGVGGADAVWTSKVLDAGIRATFGRVSWDSAGTLEMSTRSGNTKEPDDSWSDWSAPLTTAGTAKTPAARYLQVRARWNRDTDAVLRELEIPFVTDNLSAILQSIEAKSGATAEGTKDGVEKSGEPIDDEASTKVKLSWKVDNPDEDELRYRVEYRMVGTKTWFDMLDPEERLTKTSYDWETEFMPEGRYRVRVTVSDELSNPPDRVRRHELTSHIVLVDNSAPSIEGLRAQGRRVSGRAVDGVGPIARVELARAGTEEWFPFYPTDGIFDESREEFSADVSSLVPNGAAMLHVRVYDRAGNFVVRSVIVE
jgi:hypothetical protein